MTTTSWHSVVLNFEQPTTKNIFFMFCLVQVDSDEDVEPVSSMPNLSDISDSDTSPDKITPGQKTPSPKPSTSTDPDPGGPKEVRVLTWYIEGYGFCL